MGKVKPISEGVIRNELNKLKRQNRFLSMNQNYEEASKLIPRICELNAQLNELMKKRLGW